MSHTENLDRATALLRAGKPADAAAVLGAILAREPNHAIAAHLLGLALKDTGDWAQGEQWLRFSIGLAPEHGEFHANLGNLLDPNVYVHKTICRRGAYVGFDRQGGPNDAADVPLVMALLEAGFADNLLFSADQSRGFGRTLTAFLPKLKAAGASDAVLHKIMVDNPRRFLAFVPKRPRKR